VGGPILVDRIEQVIADAPFHLASVGFGVQCKAKSAGVSSLPPI
jgi:hypothetical protein